MPLIACPECDANVSTAAPACPSCGHPVGRRGRGGKITTTQQTAKKWKLCGLVGFLAFVTGFVLLVVGINSTGQPAPGPIVGGVFLIIGGLGLAIFGKLAAWWFHG